ncbi:hypothetical protein [Thiomicrorhabdus aquaedulcis]|uniref:hypothetical protein n=1 Tax=Thiomicrorhabdus aquaedulcis TaxID=2211106 RepID=UPI000FD7AEA7|nr:hypothetical protein [Thiomicrorhabdus aquaedulcis]
MKQVDHMAALKLLLDIDTTVFKEELYYPWFIQKPAIIGLSVAWLLFASGSIMLLATLTKTSLLVLILIFSVLTFALVAGYAGLVKTQIGHAKSKVLNLMMRLEKQYFMKGIQPFVPADQQTAVKRIAKDKTFTPKEYTSITLSTQSRVLFNTESFIKEIERMLADPDIKITPNTSTDFDENTFRVPQSARKNYDKIKNSSTFNDVFTIPPEAKKAILVKVHDLVNQAALGKLPML